MCPTKLTEWDHILPLSQSRILCYKDGTPEFQVLGYATGDKEHGQFERAPVQFVGEWDARRIAAHCGGEEGIYLLDIPDPNPQEGPKQLLHFYSNAIRLGNERPPLPVPESALELPDGQVLTVSRDGQMNIWNPSGSTPIRSFGDAGLRIEGFVMVQGRILISWRLFVPWTFSVWDLQTGGALGSIQAPLRPGRAPTVTLPEGADPYQISVGNHQIRWDAQGIHVFEVSSTSEECLGSAVFDPKSVRTLGVTTSKKSVSKARSVQRAWKWHGYQAERGASFIGRQIVVWDFKDSAPCTPLLFTSEGVVVATMPDGTVEFLNCMRGAERFVPRFRKK
jgi:hypothetical protein